MQDVTVDDCRVGARSGKRSIYRFLNLLCMLVALVHLRAFDCASETAVPHPAAKVETVEAPKLDFQATAYCESGTTKSGAPAAPGIVAADPRVLPLGSLIRVDVSRYDGVYQVMDTGRLVKGRIIDIYIPDYDLATEFGRRMVKVTVLRYGFPATDLDAVSD
jgi:3D (Asp-Asp-Asp) domain-containing protein